MVAILLCTYQGQSFLAEQLESIASQTHPHWVVWASDDGSNDQTINILLQFQKKWGADRLKILSGPQKGFAENFLSLIKNNEIQSDFYAFSDQDDIWKSDKLQRAIHWACSVPSQTAGLYCARTQYISASKEPLGESPYYRKRPCFAHALVQNIASGNTMVMNHAGRLLVQEYSSGKHFPLHDWWTYLIISGCGGSVYYDLVPAVEYRQHENNLIGSNAGLKAGIKRIRFLFKGTYKKINESHIAALKLIQDQLTPEHRNQFQLFVRARKLSLFKRLLLLKRSGVYRQSALQNLGLITAAFFNKF